jgi:hypothetical protein
VKGTSEVRLAGLVAVRVAWMAAIVVCALAILIGLFTGTDGADSSQQLPGFAFSRDSSHQVAESGSLDPAAPTVRPAVQDGRRGLAKTGKDKHAGPRDGHSAFGVPPRSGSQPEDTGAGTRVVTRRPKPPQAPEDYPAGAPQAPAVTPPKPLEPPTPPGTPAVTQPKPPKATEPKPPKETEPKPPKVTEPKPPKSPSVTEPKPPKD